MTWSSPLHDPCAGCGFSSAAHAPHDIHHGLRTLAQLASFVFGEAGADASGLVAVALHDLRDVVHQACRVLGEEPVASGPAVPLDEQVTRSVEAVTRLCGDSPQGSAAQIGCDTVHHFWHWFAAVADQRHADGDVVDESGHVVQVSASDGGLPKVPVLQGQIDRSGLAGDRQRTVRHHGRPWQALCLWSADVIDQLVVEGHSIAPGSAGENLTLTGVDWTQMRHGLHVRIGEVHARLSVAAIPCAQNRRWFADGNESRIDHRIHPGWARWYATVITGGTINAGDEVSIRSD